MRIQRPGRLSPESHSSPAIAPTPIHPLPSPPARIQRGRNPEKLAAAAAPSPEPAGGALPWGASGRSPGIQQLIEFLVRHNRPPCVRSIRLPASPSRTLAHAAAAIFTRPRGRSPNISAISANGICSLVRPGSAHLALIFRQRQSWRAPTDFFQLASAPASVFRPIVAQSARSIRPSPPASRVRALSKPLQATGFRTAPKKIRFAAVFRSGSYALPGAQ